MEIGGPSKQKVAPLLNQGKSAFQRDIERARDAYLKGDTEASRNAHSARNISLRPLGHDESHTGAHSEYLKALVFGGLDGIVTIFAIVAGCVGAHLSPLQTIIVGCGNLLADAVSMGFGEFVSASTESDFMRSEKARELWEIDNFPEGEKQEMMEIYMHKYNFSQEDAQAMVDITFKYKDFCISHMMAEELGLLVDEDGPSPLQRGGVMFSAFVIFGLVPLAGFTLWSWFTNQIGVPTESGSSQLQAFWAASLASCITLFTLGAIKATFINQSSFKSGLQMVANGIFAGSVAYGVGAFLQEMVGQSPIG